MKRISMRRAFAYASVLVATLALAPSAFAHAELFPSSVPAGDGQLLMLTVPNEKEDASTTEIQITIPDGFDLEHVAPVPDWTPTVSGQHHVERGDGGRGLDHLEGQAERGGARRPAVHRRAEERRRVHVRRPPDVLRRQRRRVVRDGGLRHARGAHRGDQRGEFLGQLR